MQQVSHQQGCLQPAPVKAMVQATGSVRRPVSRQQAQACPYSLRSVLACQQEQGY